MFSERALLFIFINIIHMLVFLLAYDPKRGIHTNKVRQKVAHTNEVGNSIATLICLVGVGSIYFTHVVLTFVL